jgi:hypothetical protein
MKSFANEIRKAFSTSLEGMLVRQDFHRVGSPPLFIWRHGPLFMALSIHVRSQYGEAVVVPLMRWWHVALSKDEDLNGRTLSWLIQHDGIEECYAAPNFLNSCRFREGDDFADVM